MPEFSTFCRLILDRNVLIFVLLHEGTVWLVLAIDRINDPVRYLNRNECRSDACEIVLPPLMPSPYSSSSSPSSWSLRSSADAYCSKSKMSSSLSGAGRTRLSAWADLWTGLMVEITDE